MKISIKRPGTAADGGAFTAEIELFGAAAGDLRHTITPSLNLWWEVESGTLVRVAEGAWCRIDSYLTLDFGAQTSDALGQTKGPYWSLTTINVGYSSIRARALYKLEAGKTYIARPILLPTLGTWELVPARAVDGLAVEGGGLLVRDNREGGRR